MIGDQQRQRTVAALRRLETDGGYPDVEGGPPTLGGTLSALKSLALLGERAPDPDAVHAWLIAAIDPATGTWPDPAGAPSVLATAAGLLGLREIGATGSLDRWLAPGLRTMSARAATREEHFMTIAVADECGVAADLSRSVAYFRSLAAPDQTFGTDPLTNAIAASALLRAGQELPDPAAVTRLLLAAQSSDGAFADDLWTSYCTMRALVLLDVAPGPGLAGWVLRAACPEGGFGTGSALATGTTYQSLSVLDWIAAPMLAAARAGDQEATERHLRAGADPDLRDLCGWTPLAAAAVRGQAAAVRRLLDAGADPDLRVPRADALPIFWAGQSGSLDTVRELLTARPAHLFATSAVNGHTVLLQAVFFGTERHRDLAAWLIAHAAEVLGIPERDADHRQATRRRLLAACNVRGYTATTMSALWHNPEMSALLAEVDDTTPAERDDYYRWLLATIAPPPPDDLAAQRATDDLIERIEQAFAAPAGAFDVTALLADVTAAVTAPGFDINRRGGPLGQTPIVVAVTGVDPDAETAAGRQRLTALLLRYGADPDLPERHPMAVDAVIRAAVLNHFECLREIAGYMGPLAFAAALNEPPAINGQTALDDTVHRALTAPPDSLDRHLEQIRWAIEHGARTDIADLTGVTVADRARLAVGDEIMGGNATRVLQALGITADEPALVAS
ncbi:ankyrin repeat domain-containing protein [Mangrovihabitans endophyticus]|uniref:Ankyrin repeat-containing protein n=1 Tax=Mangrovihabitans endophyticus TaxID=1751298 RepID=A0A8J3C0E3_9ACTN|nr:ankyrin repeat domain-containing protein [Mangrovihabitans endophyticus]GGK99720.1 hypothetical protein GCM10012284_37660 [Mangrovihabitans endophyticus]